MTTLLKSQSKHKFEQCYTFGCLGTLHFSWYNELVYISPHNDRPIFLI